MIGLIATWLAEHHLEPRVVTPNKDSSMTLPTLLAAQQGQTVLTLQDFLHHEHQEGRLVPWLRRAARDAFLIEHARALGLRVEDAELQRTVDIFRRRRNLVSADATHAWLKARDLTQDDLEAALERRLLIAKLKAQVGQAQAPQRFQQRPGDYDRLRLRQMLLPREDLAREILTQLSDEGGSFGELAQRHSQHPSRTRGGNMGRPFRIQLPVRLRDALAQKKPGEVSGPIAAREGLFLFLIEELTPAALDPETTAFISTQLFREWLAERLASAPFTPRLLDGLQ